MALIIKKYNNSDLEDFLSLIMKREIEENKPYYNKEVMSSLDEKNLFFLSLIDKKLFGYIYVYKRQFLKGLKVEGEEAEIHDAYILSDYRNKGHYKEFKKKVIECIKEENVKRIFSDVSINNLPCISVNRSLKMDEKKNYDSIRFYLDF